MQNKRETEPREWGGAGINGYDAGVLKAINGLPKDALEVAESLEQLRWLEAGYKIGVAQTEVPTYGIDTPEDLAEVIKIKQQEID